MGPPGIVALLFHFFFQTKTTRFSFFFNHLRSANLQVSVFKNMFFLLQNSKPEFVSFNTGKNNKEKTESKKRKTAEENLHASAFWKRTHPHMGGHVQDSLHVAAVRIETGLILPFLCLEIVSKHYVGSDWEQFGLNLRKKYLQTWRFVYTSLLPRILQQTMKSLQTNMTKKNSMHRAPWALSTCCLSHKQIPYPDAGSRFETL